MSKLIDLVGLSRFLSKCKEVFIRKPKKTFTTNSQGVWFDCERGHLYRIMVYSEADVISVIVEFSESVEPKAKLESSEGDSVDNLVLKINDARMFVSYYCGAASPWIIVTDITDGEQVSLSKYSIYSDLIPSTSIEITIERTQSKLTFDTTPTANSSNPVTSGGVKSAIDAKQETLVSGTNIKTINNESLLGSGNISITGGSGGEANVIEAVTFNGTPATITNKTAAITATIPNAPGTLNTNNTTAQTANSSEALSGTINLHKIAKTGNYNDLLNKPTITPGAFIAEYGNTQFSDILDAYNQGSLVVCKYNSLVGQLSEIDENSGALFIVYDSAVPSLVYLIVDNTDTWDDSTQRYVSEFDGKYNSLEGKPTIPAAVTESTVTGWGFTKNTGTYSKPSGGIPKTDLASAVQTSLGKADTALQSFTETDPTVPSWAKASTKPTYTASEVGALPDTTSIPTESTVSGWGFTKNTGTVTGVKINGTTNTPTSGTVDLGTVLTSETALSKGTTTGNGNAVTDISVSGHTITLTKGSTFLTSETSLSKGTATGSGNVVTDLSVSGHTITLTKGSTVPVATSANAGKIPRITSSGAWEYVTPAQIYSGSAAPNNSNGNNGDIYVQT